MINEYDQTRRRNRDLFLPGLAYNGPPALIVSKACSAQRCGQWQS